MTATDDAQNENDRLTAALEELSLRESSLKVRLGDAEEEVRRVSKERDQWKYRAGKRRLAYRDLVIERDQLAAERDAAVSREVAQRKWLTAKSAEASRESDYGLNVGPVHRMRCLDMVLAWLDEYPHDRAEGETSE